MNLLVCIIILALLGILYKIEYCNNVCDFLGFLENPSKSASLKMLCAVIVLVGHTWAGNPWLKPIHDLGYLMVAVFFALSGYGIAKTEGKLEKAPVDWIVRRIKKIIIPFWFMNLCCIILYGLTIEKMNLYKVLGYFVGIPLINHPAWFLWMLLLLDIGYAACYVRKNRYSLGFMLVYILIVSAICAWAGLDKAWYGSNFAFALGILIEAKETKICNFINPLKKWFGLLGICFLVTGIGSLMYKLLSLGAFIDYFILRNIISLAFCMGLFISMYRIKLTCRISILEKCYFEVFLIHTPVQVILAEKFDVNTSFALTLLTLAVTLIISVCWHATFGMLRAKMQFGGKHG